MSQDGKSVSRDRGSVSRDGGSVSKEGGSASPEGKPVSTDGESASGEVAKDPSRRDFLKKTAGAVPGAAIAGTLGAGACAPDAPDRTGGPTGAGDRAAGAEGAASGDEAGSVAAGVSRDVALPEGPLRAVAETVLPTGALGTDGTARALRGFVAWIDGFEPAAELDHPYLTGALRYGPAHPGPRWAAQLEAMELESLRRTGASLLDRPEAERVALLEEAVREEDSAGLPGDPARADHVAVGLLAWFYGTSEANDLCYRAEIGRHLCRGIETLPEEPAPLEGA